MVLAVMAGFVSTDGVKSTKWWHSGMQLTTLRYKTGGTMDIIRLLSVEGITPL